MKRLFWILALTLLACHRPAPKPASLADAGLVRDAKGYVMLNGCVPGVNGGGSVIYENSPTNGPIPDGFVPGGCGVGQPDAAAHAAAPKLPGSMVVEGDAGASIGSVSALSARVEARKRWMATHPPPKMQAVQGGPGDPRVVACQVQTTKQGLLDCLEPLKTAPKLAPGKLGSVRPPIICPAQAITDWYFASGGSNENSCTNSGSPCTDTTGPQEVEARWGCGGSPSTTPVITAATVFHIPAAGMQPSSHFVIDPVITGSGSFSIVGTPVVTSGTVSGLIAKNGLAGQPLTVNLTSAATYKYQLFVDTTRGSHATVDAALSTNVARLTQPIDPVSLLENDLMANGDGYTLGRQPEVYLDAFRPTCGVVRDVFAQPSQPCASRANLQSVYLPSVALGSATFEATQLRNVTITDSYVGGVVNAKFSWLINTQLAFIPETCTNCIYVAGANTSTFLMGTEDEQFGVYLANDVYLHGFSVIPPLSVVTYDSFWLDPAQEMIVDGSAYTGHLLPASTSAYGIWSLNPGAGTTPIISQFPGSILTYDATGTMGAAGSFSPGLSLQTEMGPEAYAINAAEGHDMIRGPRPLSLSALDTSVLNGGFGGVALNGSLSSGYYRWAFSLPPTVPFSAQPFTAIGGIPTVTPQASFWLRSDYAKTVSGNLTVLRDESGNNYDFDSPSGAIPFSTLPWIHFSTQEISPTAGALGLGDHSTVFVAIRSSGAGANRSTIWDNGNLQILDKADNGFTNWGTYVGAYLDSGHNVDDGLPHILVMRTHTASNVDLITDGALTNAAYGTAYQNRSTNINDGLQWVGDVAELAAFNADLSNQTIDQVDHYLGGRYGVPIADISPPCDALTGDTSGTVCANVNVAVQGQSWSSTQPTVSEIPVWTQIGPIDIPGLFLYLDSDLGITTSSGNVSAWLDQSTHAYNFTQATAGNRFQYTASGGLNGHGYLTKTGSGDALEGTVGALSQPYDAFFIGDRSGDGYMMDFGSNDHECQITGGNYVCYPFSQNWGAVSTGPHLYEVNWTAGTAGFMTVDGVQVAVNNLGATPPGTALTIGNYGGGGNAWSYRIYGVIIYDHTLSSTDRNRLGAIVHARWGITVAGATSSFAWVPTASSSSTSSSLTYEGQAVQIAAAGSGNGKLLWPAALSAPTLSQSAPTSDVATSVTNILGQPAFSGATGTNRNGGSIYFGGGNSAAGGVNGPALFGSGAATYAFTSNANAAFGIGNTPGTDPTITRGTGVPATTQPNGSLFLRTDGSGGTDALYARESSAWSPVGGTVSSVTGAGTVSCSPTTGAVTCTGTNAVSSVSGSSGVSCSPTTGAVNCTNTGVTSATAGTGMSVSAGTGAVTFTNAGVTSLTAGTNISLSGSTGGVTVSVTNPPALGFGATGTTLSGSTTGTFVSVIGTSMTVPASANVAVKASISCQDTDAADQTFEWAIGVDGSVVPYATQRGFCTVRGTSNGYCSGSIDMVVSGLSTGSHTFDLIQAISGAVLPVSGAGCVGTILVTAN